jgi:hypothetical protein
MITTTWGGIAAIAGARTTARNATRLVDAHGTLIVIIPTRDGLVIGADRRTNDAVHHDRDNALKIRTVGRYTTVSAVGQPTFFDRSMPDLPLYDAPTIARDYLASRNLAGLLQQHMEPLAKTLIEKLQDYLRLYPPGALEQQENDILFNMIFGHMVETSGPYEVTVLSIGYRPDIPAPTFPYRTYDEALLDARPIIHGNIKAWEVLAKTSDPRFAKWRNDPAISRLNGRPRAIASVSAEEGLAYCRAMIRATSEILPLVDTSVNHVGRTVDIGILLKRSGFRWLFRDRGGAATTMAQRGSTTM